MISSKSQFLTLLAELALLVFVLFFLFGTNNNLKDKIKEIEFNLKLLEREKKDLQYDKFKLIDSLYTTSLEIDKLIENQSKVVTENKDLKVQIKLLKDKYEKANNIANNYTADSIRKYFSNIK